MPTFNALALSLREMTSHTHKHKVTHISQPVPVSSSNPTFHDILRMGNQTANTRLPPPNPTKPLCEDPMRVVEDPPAEPWKVMPRRKPLPTALDRARVTQPVPSTLEAHPGFLDLKYLTEPQADAMALEPRESPRRSYSTNRTASPGSSDFSDFLDDDQVITWDDDDATREKKVYTRPPFLILRKRKKKKRS